MMTPAFRLLCGLTLTVVAGFVDALAFIELGGYFASFMSGNATQLGLALGAPSAMTALAGQSIFMPLVLMLCFFTGAFGITYFRGADTHLYSPAALILVSLMLVGAMVTRLVVADHLAAILWLAAAMGGQNAVFKNQGPARLGATFITGTLFQAAYDLAAGLRGWAPRWRWLQNVAVLLALICGAALGAVAYYLAGLWSLCLPVVVLYIMLVMIWYWDR